MKYWFSYPLQLFQTVMRLDELSEGFELGRLVYLGEGSIEDNGKLNYFY